MAKRGQLTVKQDKFARELAKTGNGTLAAIRAGYSERSARSIASENLTKPAVAEEVARHRSRLAERLDISREKLLNDQAHDVEAASIAGNWAAATAGRQLIAKAQGYITDRSVTMSIDGTAAHLEAVRSLASLAARHVDAVPVAHDDDQ